MVTRRISTRNLIFDGKHFGKILILKFLKVFFNSHINFSRLDLHLLLYGSDGSVKIINEHQQLLSQKRGVEVQMESL